MQFTGPFWLVGGTGSPGSSGSGGGLPDPGGNGIVVRNGAGSTVARTLTAGAGIAITNGDGVAGNPTIAESANGLASAIIVDTQMSDGSVLSTGSKGYVQVPFSGTITNWTVLLSPSGSIVFDIKRSTFAGYPTTATIVGGGNKPTVVASPSATAAVSGWTSVAITAGDIIEFNVDSITTATWAKCQLSITRT